MELRLEHTLKQKQELTIEQRLQSRNELRMEIIQRLGADIEAWREEIIGPTPDLLRNVIQRVVDASHNQKLKQGLTGIIGDKSFVDTLLIKASQLAVPGPKAVNAATCEFAYNLGRDGEFVLQRPGNEGSEPENVHYKVTRFAFFQAWQSPEKVQEQIEALEQAKKHFVSQGERDKAARIQLEIGERKDSLQVTQAFAEISKTIHFAIGYLATHRIAKGDLPPVQEFFRELTILKNFNTLISERIQQRFASRFSQMTKESKAEEYQDAFLLTIGEYAMVSMGVVSAELFKLSRQEISEEEYIGLKERFESTGMKIENVLGKRSYSLGGKRTIYWNRWALTGAQPTAQTDEKVAEFITGAVRDEAAKLLAAADFNQLFEKIKKEIISTGSGVEDRKDLSVALQEFLVDSLSSEQFKEALRSSIKGPWYAQIQKLMFGQ